MYATQQDMIDRFGEDVLIELTDRTNTPASSIDATVIATALNDASVLADGYLKPVLQLPLSVVPDVLVKIVADIALYYLYGDKADKESAVTRHYNEAIETLEKVAKGLIQISTGAQTPEAAGGGQIKASAPGRVFTRDSLRYL